MDVTIQLELCLDEQIQIEAKAACRVGSQHFLDSYLLVVSLSICISTPFILFNLLIIYNRVSFIYTQIWNRVYKSLLLACH